MKIFKIKKEAAGQRLDVYLVSQLNLSRSQVQKTIKNGLVFVNENITNAHNIINQADIITIHDPIAAATDAMEAEKRLIMSLTEMIVLETKEYLVINKPAGLIVHGGEGIKEETLTDLLIKQYPQIKKVGEDPLRPGIVHRLDKEVSGLLVVALTNEMFDHLKRQFIQRQVTKKYLALVHEKIEKDYDEIGFPIARSAKGYKMAARPENQTGRRAVTEFEVIKRYVNYTLLLVKIKTGRTHQIRVHLSAYGYPLVGDDLYGTKKTRLQNKKLNLGRIFLHSHILAFSDLKNEVQELKTDLPEKLLKFLEVIK
ncbi:MAG: RluA family pseudouridine synthase [bacterium]|nr:RluA family pseudouridine synthase [bacterium]